jgi:hypothetical protein
VPPHPAVRRRSPPCPRTLVVALAAGLVALAWPDVAAAQSGGGHPASSAPAAAPSSGATECFGFAFGTWTPALDWRRGGHGTDAPRVRLAGEFAARDSTRGDQELTLFPSWWPAGVGVHFARPPRALGDTVQGVAVAFVADGRLRPPRTTVRAWLKPCGSGRG